MRKHLGYSSTSCERFPAHAVNERAQLLLPPPSTGNIALQVVSLESAGAPGAARYAILDELIGVRCRGTRRFGSDGVGFEALRQREAADQVTTLPICHGSLSRSEGRL
jgi:hypothetical protein